jgi:hypothetical protein
VRDVGEGPGRKRTSGEPVQRGDCRRSPVDETLCDLEHTVGQQFIVEQLSPARQRLAGFTWLRPVVAFGQRDVGVREPIELEVLVAVGKCLELLEDLVERHRLLDGGQLEARLALQGDRGDDAEGADADAGRGVQLRIRLVRDLDDRVVGEDELQPSDLCRDATEPRPRAVRAGRDGAGDRLRIDVAEVAHR